MSELLQEDRSGLDDLDGVVVEQSRDNCHKSSHENFLSTTRCSDNDGEF